MTAFLLACGASPQAPGTSTPAEGEAKLLGHWLAAAIISAWTKRAEITETEAITGRFQ